LDFWFVVLGSQREYVLSENRCAADDAQLVGILENASDSARNELYVLRKASGIS
jgi:predicted nucleic acid-binding Zn finger protein